MSGAGQAPPAQAGSKEAAEPFAASARFTDAEVESLYGFAVDLIRQGQYEKALNLVLVAAVYRPTQARYFRAVGICHKKLDQHDAAIQAFQMATSLEPDDMESALHVAESLLALEREDEALPLLRSVQEYAQASGEHPKVLERANALLSLRGET